MKQKLDEMNNKKEYLQTIANSKKIIGRDIKEIDKKINNNKLLRESFSEENKNLEESKKIFKVDIDFNSCYRRRNCLWFF